MSEVNDTLEFGDDANEYMIDYASWETLDNNDLAAEFTAIWNQIYDGCGLLNKMLENSDCKKTEDGLMALAMGPVSRNNWLSTFRSHNSDAFSKYISGESRPTWYGSLEPQKKRQYDTCLKYYKDAVRLEEPFDNISRMLVEIVSGETIRWNYRLLKIRENFADQGIDEKFYKKVEVDARQVSDRINQPGYDFERIAQSAKAYREQYYDKKSESDFEQGYRKARLKDYIDDFRGRALNDSFGVLSDGSFYVQARTLAMARAVDSYTNHIAQKENYGDTLKKVDANCQKILKEILIPGEKDCETESGHQLFSALRQLVTAVSAHMIQTLDELDAYKSANADTAPYCFMRTLSAYDAIKPRFALTSQKVDPWDHGTEYADLYIKEAVSLTEHCEAFVKK